MTERRNYEPTGNWEPPAVLDRDPRPAPARVGDGLPPGEADRLIHAGCPAGWRCRPDRHECGPGAPPERRQPEPPVDLGPGGYRRPPGGPQRRRNPRRPQPPDGLLDPAAYPQPPGHRPAPDTAGRPIPNETGRQ